MYHPRNHKDSRSLATKADEDLAVGKANRRVLKESIQVTEGIGEEIQNCEVGRFFFNDLMGFQWIGLENHCKIFNSLWVLCTLTCIILAYTCIYIYMNRFI